MKAKNFLKTICTSVFATMLAFNLSSCTNDTTNEEYIDPYATKSIVCVHSLDITLDYLHFYDITATYEIDGEVHETEISEDIFKKTLNFDTDFCELPKSISCVVKATPKNPIPEYDETETYHFDYINRVNIRSIKNNGETVEHPFFPQSQKLPLGGVKIKDYLKKGERKIASFEFKR